MALAAHASDPSEGDRLRYLASPAGKVVNFLSHSVMLLVNLYNVLLTCIYPFFYRMNMHSG